MEKIIKNVLTAFYQPFSFAALLAVLFMFLFLFAREHGWKGVCRQWWSAFRTESSFRRTFLLVFYTAMILFRTLLNRNMWANPLSNVFGSWGLYNEKGELTTEAIENLILFIPFVILLMWNFREKLLKEKVKLIWTLWQSMRITFVFSLTIEFLQLFLRLGTFQLSDIAYNTAGGLVGGLLYWVGYKLGHRISRDEEGKSE